MGLGFASSPRWEGFLGKTEGFIRGELVGGGRDLMMRKEILVGAKTLGNFFSLFPIFLNNRKHPGTAVKGCPKRQPISRLCYS